jgi:Phosphodiester glycosidase
VTVRFPRRLLGGVLALSLLIALPTGTASARVLSRRTLAPGVVLTRIYDPHGPWHIFVVDVNLKRAATMDVALAGSGSGFMRTSQMAAAHKALVAVNGDFGVWPVPRPTHAFAEDGFLRFTPAGPHSANIAVSESERHLYLGRDKPVIRLQVPRFRKPFQVGSWNAGTPRRNQLAGFTPPRSVTGAAHSCSLRMRPLGKPAWAPKRSAVQRTYRVGTVACSKDPLRLVGATVLSARRDTRTSAKLQHMKPGTTVTLSWTFGWKDTLDSIAGLPILLKAGRLRVSRHCTASFCQRQPRTGVGFTKKGHLLLVVVDGRRDGWSVGMTLVEFARLFKSLGATRAMNLDGGGSSTMVIRGKVINKPTDTTGERAVTSALLVLAGPDPGERIWRLRDASAASPSSASDATGANALTDPGSTGGMAQAVVSGALGGSTASIPDWMRVVARSFERRSTG